MRTMQIFKNKILQKVVMLGDDEDVNEFIKKYETTGHEVLEIKPLTQLEIEAQEAEILAKLEAENKP